MEQIDLCLDYKDHVLCRLVKSKIPIISKVIQDELVKVATKNFDYSLEDGCVKHYPYLFPKELENLDFNILAIVGQSGSGKSLFSKYFGEEEIIEWDDKKAIISHFENEEDAINKLSSVGLNTIPTWVKPRNVLSVGEGFRVDLARRIKNGCVIDEFTSTIDRDVAKSCSISIQNYIRKNNIKKCVFVSCHKDFIDYLCPDYVIDLDDECVYDTRRLPIHQTRLQVYEEQNKQSIWKIFGKYHYLSNELNYACRIISLRDGDNPIGMCAILPLPNGCFSNGYRIHRLVVLPEYQGMHLGTKLLDIVCNMLVANDKVPYIRTSHARLKSYFDKSAKWQETLRSGKVSPKLFDRYDSDNRIAYSYKYIGDYKENNLSNIELKIKDEKVEQLALC